MRFPAVMLVLTLCFATVVLASGPAQIMGSVEAVYHEGLVTFQVNHTDAVSMSIKVYDLETDSLVYDSGPRAKTLVSWPAGYDVTGSFRYVVTAWNDQGEVVVSQAAVTKNLTPITAISFDTIPGGTKLLGPNEIIMGGDVQVGDPQRARLDYGGSQGGSLSLYEEDGTKHTYIDADVNGEGVYAQFSGPGGSYVSIDGDYLGNGSPKFTINGASDFIVTSSSTGNYSVSMPADSVSAAEILNEAGAAATFSITSRNLTSTADSIAARTITVPTNGYVLATAFVDAFLNHAAGTTSEYSCSISDTLNTQYYDGIAAAQISSGAGTGGYRLPISLTRIFKVSAGSHTLHFVCSALSVSDITIYDRHLDLLFVPTALGTVSTSSLKSEGDHRSYSGSKMEEGWVDPGDDDFSNAPSMTQAEVDAERAESIAFNLARIQAELDAIKAEAEALSADDNNQR